MSLKRQDVGLKTNIYMLFWKNMHIFVANLLKCNHLIIAAFKSLPY